MAEIVIPKEFTHLEAISSLDGRFRGRVEDMSQYFSEFATIKGRVYVEIEYLIALLKEIGQPLSREDKKKIRRIHESFSRQDAQEVFRIDEEINHDSKAVEYFLAAKFKELDLGSLVNFIHFGLTSTDIDNTALALSLKRFNEEVYVPSVEQLISALSTLSSENKDLVMLARTHGQVAVPTTAGKEVGYFADRLTTQLEKFRALKIGSKINGAVGNYNALVAAFPEIDWPAFSKKFLSGLGLTCYEVTTQVEPYEHKVEYIQAVRRINSVICALDEDIWRYLAIGYLSLRDSAGHVGSSTMPQKINPIGFEMSESYASLGNGILAVMEERLPLNRWQRDLTDKYLLRDLGQALVMSVLAYQSTAEALGRIGFNRAILEKDLDNHFETIAEGIQTILRAAGVDSPYEMMKALTRGKEFTRADFEKFIDGLDIPENVRDQLRKLSPKTYTGIAG